MLKFFYSICYKRKFIHNEKLKKKCYNISKKGKCLYTYTHIYIHLYIHIYIVMDNTIFLAIGPPKAYLL